MYHQVMLVPQVPEEVRIKQWAMCETIHRESRLGTDSELRHAGPRRHADGHGSGEGDEDGEGEHNDSDADSEFGNDPEVPEFVEHLDADLLAVKPQLMKLIKGKKGRRETYGLTCVVL
jgi:hypothetical protein